jgi:hypothetical protein
MKELDKWIENTEIYFDNRISSANALIDSKLREEFDIHGFEAIKSLDEYNDSRKLKVLILSTETEFDFKQTNHTITVLIESSNTNLFGAQSQSKGDITISSAKEVEQCFEDLFQKIVLSVDKIQVELIDYAEDFFKKIVQKKKVQNYQFEKYAHKYDQVLEEVIACLDLNELVSKIEKITETHLNEVYTIIAPPQAFLEDRTHLLGFNVKDSVYFLSWDKNQEHSLEKSLLVYNAIDQFIKRFEGNVIKQEYGMDYSTILNAIPFPIALFDNKGELTLHNAKFVGLNLTAKKCYSLEDNHQLTIKNELYKVHKINQDENTLYYFAKVTDFIGEDDHDHSQSSDLGIITSSIAHELNNPLAGIMAALDVILLDFESPEMASNITDMKETVIRCKKLVETFLGFSKYRPQTEEAYDEKIQNCFNQAIELIRFRLIENNLNIVTHFETDQGFNNSFNPHVMTMIFYLTFGELLTNFSHHKLVADDRSTSILIEFIETKDSFTIKKPEEFSLSSQFLQGKLIRHLLVTQSLKFKYSSDEMKFYI